MSDQIPLSWEQVKTPTLPPDNPKSITSPESTIVKKLCFFQFSDSRIIFPELNWHWSKPENFQIFNFEVIQKITIWHFDNLAKLTLWSISSFTIEVLQISQALAKANNLIPIVSAWLKNQNLKPYLSDQSNLCSNVCLRTKHLQNKAFEKRHKKPCAKVWLSWKIRPDESCKKHNFFTYLHRSFIDLQIDDTS